MLVFDLAFDRPVNGLGADDFASATNSVGCAFAPSATSGTSFAVTVTGCPDGTLVARLLALSVSDADDVAGPANPVDAPGLDLDRTPPDLLVQWLSTNDHGAGAPTDLVFSISSVDGIDCSTVSASIGVDFDPVGISALGPVQGSHGVACGIPATSSVTFDHFGQAGLALAPGFSVNDLAGNTATTANTGLAFAQVDRRDRPRVVITGPDGAAHSGSITFTLTFDQPVSGLTRSDYGPFGPPGCTPGDPTTVSPTTYTVVVTGCLAGSILDFYLINDSVTDEVGNTGPSTAAEAQPVVIDDTAPVMTGGPSLTLRPGATLSGTRIPVSVAFGGSDAGGAGLQSFEISRSIDGGVTWGVPFGVAGSPYRTFIATGGRVRFRIRAVDRVGNRSAWSYGSPISARLIQQGSASVAYHGTWTPVSADAYSGGSIRAASVAGRSATFTFTGRAVGWVTTMAPTRGKAKIYVDGVYKATVDLRAASWTARALAWRISFSSSATRTLKVVVVGTAGRPRVDVDAFVVLS